MSIVLTVVAVIIMFSVIVGIHEFAHMWFAKMFGVRVYHYSIGMGPVIKKWKRKETEYTLRWLLIGGFVLISGTIPTLMKGKPVFAAIEDGYRIRYIGRRRKLQKIWTGEIVKIVPSVVQDDSIHAKDGKFYAVMKNTEIVIGGSVYPMEREGERLIDKSVWKQIVVFIAGSFANFVLAFICIFLVAVFTQTKGISFDFEATWKIVIGLTKLTVEALGNIFAPHGMDKLGGAVYVVGVVHSAVKTAFWNSVGLLTLFTGFLSLSVGIMNLLPIPPLDGFHVIRVIIDRIVGWSYPILMGLTILGSLTVMVFAIIVNANNVIQMIH